MTQKTLSQKSNGQMRNTYFTEVISESGIIINNDDKPNIFTQEQSLILREINRILKNHISYPDNAQEFVSGLKSFCQNENKFRRALLPSVLHKMSEGNSLTLENDENKVYQDSLFRILLTVESLQSDIIELLLDHIKDEACKEGNDTSWLRTLLSPLKYLPFLRDEENFTSKILEIIENAHYTSQLEIINLIPDIIPDSQYTKTANTLSRLIEVNTNLTGAVIDCLNSLELSNDTKSDLQDYVLTRLELNPSPDIFPILFEFLVSDSSACKLYSVLNKARNVLDTIMSFTDGKKEIDTNKVLTINHLRSLMLASKSLRDGLISFINGIRVHTDHKPIDLLLLVLLYKIAKNCKLLVDNTFKRKIKAGLFRTSLLESLFENYMVPQIVKEYLDSMLEICTNLLQQQKEATLYNFVGTMYRLLFNYKHIDRVQRQDIINSLILLAGTSGQKYVSSVLDILMSLSDSHSILQEFTFQLMSLLELLDFLELKDVGKIFDLLCSLTCGEKAISSLSGFKDELHILIRKQLCSTKRRVKHQGIVSAVMMIKHMVITSVDQSEVSFAENEDSINIADLPSENSREAAALFELISTNTLNRADNLGLFYDQLASLIFTSTNVEKHFQHWIFERMTNNFKVMFVTDVVPEPMNDINFSMQFSLNEEHEIDSPIAVNIAELVMKPQINQASIMTLPALFRLLRLLHFLQNDGDLSSIDALLGCAVVMPLVDNINNFDSHQIKQIADCLFHCINWFREVISGFVTQRSKRLRSRILIRLSHLIQLEKMLQECLIIVPDHTLPTSYFDSSQENKRPIQQKNEKIKRPKKKQKTETHAENLNDTTVSSITQTSKSSPKSGNSVYHTEINYREFDTDLIVLLKYPLNIGETNFMTFTQQLQINIKQFNYLINDTTKKLKILTKQIKSDSSHTIPVSEEFFINDCIRMLPHIMKNFVTIVEAIQHRLNQSDNIIDDANLFTPEMQELRSSFGKVLEFISVLLNWPGFQNPKNSSLLQDCLKLQLMDSSSTCSTEEIAINLSRKIVNYSNCCLCLSSAVHLVKILQALHSINPVRDIKKRSVSLSEQFLTRKWFTINGSRDSGRVANLNIDFLVSNYLDGVKVEILCNFITTLQEEAPGLKKKEDYLPKLQSIDKTNFHIYYRCLCNSLLEAVKNEITSLTNNGHLILWKNTAIAMQGLIAIVKHQENKSNLINFLKKSIAILKVFLSHGIPILEIMLRSKPDQVLEIFKAIQGTTRFLHHLCCASKITKDISLVAYVPQFRLTLESLLVRVKAALVANNCSAAFWMGTLKNRDLQGEDILTQSSVTSDGSRTNDEQGDELPPDDNEEIEEESSDVEHDSVSDIF